MPQPLAYLNGELVAADQAVLPVFDAGVVQGVSVAENLRTFGHQVFRLDPHLDRFTNSLAAVGFDIGLGSSELAGICRDLVAHNCVALDAKDDLGLVLFATAGPYATYSGQPAGSAAARPTLCAHTFPLPFELWATMQDQGLHLVTPSVRQLPEASIDPAIKHRSRLHYYLADLEASRIAPGAKAVLLDNQGRLTETAAASLLLVRNRQVIAPPTAGVLGSISAGVVEELCLENGLEFLRKDLWPNDLVDADEALLASTPYCLGPVTRFNDSEVGSGESGPVYDQLMTAWDQLVEIDIRKQVQQGAAHRGGPQLIHETENRS